jgi:hypothetical protein
VLCGVAILVNGASHWPGLRLASHPNAASRTPQAEIANTFSHEHLVLGQRFAPGKQAVLARICEKAGVLLDQLQRTLARCNVEHPETADERAAVLMSQPAGHGNLIAVAFQVRKVRKVRGFEFLPHGGPFRGLLQK